MTGRSQRLDLELARLDDLAVAERLRAVDLLLRRGEHAQAVPLLQHAVVLDVVRVRVRRQQERGVNLEPVDRGEERLDRARPSRRRPRSRPTWSATR